MLVRRWVALCSIVAAVASIALTTIPGTFGAVDTVTDARIRKHTAAFLDGFDLYLDHLVSSIDREAGQLTDIPIIGEYVADALDPMVGDLERARTQFGPWLATVLARPTNSNSPQLQDLVKAAFYLGLGPGPSGAVDLSQAVRDQLTLPVINAAPGLGILGDRSNNATVGPEDVGYASSATTAQFDMVLKRNLVDADLGSHELDLDLGDIPIGFDAQSGLALDVDWSLPVGFGFSDRVADAGFYATTTGDAGRIGDYVLGGAFTLPGIEVGFQLGFIHARAVDGTPTAVNVTADDAMALTDLIGDFDETFDIVIDRGNGPETETVVFDSSPAEHVFAFLASLNLQLVGLFPPGPNDALAIAPVRATVNIDDILNPKIEFQANDPVIESMTINGAEGYGFSASQTETRDPNAPLEYSEIPFGLGIDVVSGAGDAAGRVSRTTLLQITNDSITRDSIFRPNASASVALRLHVTQDLSTQYLPSTAFDLKYDFATPSVTNPGGDNMIRFDNFTVDAGELLTPIINFIGTTAAPVMDPIREVSDFLSETPVPLIDEFYDLKLIDIVPGGNVIADAVAAADAIVTMASLLEGPVVVGCIGIDLGGSGLLGKPMPCEILEAIDAAVSQAEKLIAEEAVADLMGRGLPSLSLTGTSGVDLGLFSLDGMGSILSGEPFDIIRIPIADVDQDYDAGFDLSLDPIGAFGLGASLDLDAHLAVGIDSTGLSQIANALANGQTPAFESLLDGFFIEGDPDNPELGIAVAFDAYAYAGAEDAPIAAVSVELDASAAIELNDPNGDDRLNWWEIEQIIDTGDPASFLCLVDLDASASGNVEVEVVGISFDAGGDIDPVLDWLTGLIECSVPVNAASAVLATPVVVSADHVLRVNSGPFGQSRVIGDLDDDDGVTVSVSGNASSIDVTIATPTQAAITHTYSGPFDGVVIEGGMGADNITADVSGVFVQIDGHGGDDTIVGGTVIDGGNGNDNLTGTTGADAIYGRDGGDIVSGLDGDDHIEGANGDDHLSGGGGVDEIHGEAGNDVIGGDDDNDEIHGGLGVDELYGWADDDSMFGDEDEDLMYGGGGNDDLDGGREADTIYGDEGDDTPHGGTGDDYVIGGPGADVLDGDDHDDLLEAGVSDTFADGDPGTDTLRYVPTGVATLTAVGISEAGSTLTWEEIENMAFRLAPGTEVVVEGTSMPLTLELDGGKATIKGNSFPVTVTGPGTLKVDAPDNESILTGRVTSNTIETKSFGPRFLDTITFGGLTELLLDMGIWNDELTLTGTHTEKITIPGSDGTERVTVAKPANLTNLEFHGGAGIDYLFIPADVVVSTLDAFGEGDGDTLQAGRGTSVIDGGPGQDTLRAGNAGSTLIGGSDGDVLNGGISKDNLQGGDGDDALSGGAGNDTLSAGNGTNVLKGDAGNDVLTAGTGNDWLWGGDGDDKLTAGAGGDELHGEAGKDTLTAGDGNDRLNGHAGNDTLDGGNGDDHLFGGLGLDTLKGGAGNDRVEGNEDNDSIDGGDGADHLFGNLGNDTVLGGNGNDDLQGNEGDDVMRGGAGSDRIAGGIGDDQLFGDADVDYLYGEDGNDTITGGAGNDLLDGGAGINTLVQ